MQTRTLLTLINTKAMNSTLKANFEFKISNYSALTGYELRFFKVNFFLANTKAVIISLDLIVLGQ